MSESEIIEMKNTILKKSEENTLKFIDMEHEQYKSFTKLLLTISGVYIAFSVSLTQFISNTNQFLQASFLLSLFLMLCSSLFGVLTQHKLGIRYLLKAKDKIELHLKIALKLDRGIYDLKDAQDLLNVLHHPNKDEKICYKMQIILFFLSSIMQIFLIYFSLLSQFS